MTAEPACVIRGVLTVEELRKLLPPSRTCPPQTASFSRQSVNMGIDMPVVAAVAKLLSGSANVDQVLQELLARPPRPETH